jgi:protein-L-isoaspartate(D-aspartate) O-methyltransferase
LKLQLADGGIMILPVGTTQQTLIKITRQGDEFTQVELEPVKFVPMIQGDTI